MSAPAAPLRRRAEEGLLEPRYAAAGRRSSGLAAHVGDAWLPMGLGLLLSAFSWLPVGDASAYSQIQIGALAVAALLATRRSFNEKGRVLDARRLTQLLLPIAALALTPWPIALQYMDLTWVGWGKWIALSASTAAAGMWLGGLTAPRSRLRLGIRAWTLGALAALALWFGSLLQGVGEIYTASGQTWADAVLGIPLLGLALMLGGTSWRGGGFRTRPVARRALNVAACAVAEGSLGPQVMLKDAQNAHLFALLTKPQPSIQRWFFEASVRAATSQWPMLAHYQLNRALGPALVETLQRPDNKIQLRGGQRDRAGQQLQRHDLGRSLRWARLHTISWMVRPWSRGRGELELPIQINRREVTLRTESGIAPAHLALEMELGVRTQAAAPDLTIRARAAVGRGGVRTGDPILDQLLRVEGVSPELAEALTRGLHQPLLGAINEHPCSEISQGRAMLLLPAAKILHPREGTALLQEGLSALAALVDGLEERALSSGLARDR